MKIVKNVCYGGFGVSRELGIPWDGYGYVGNETMGITSDDYNAYRVDRRLIAAIEKIGCERASGDMAALEVVEIPDGIKFEIDDYDGIETIREARETW